MREQEVVFFNKQAKQIGKVGVTTYLLDQNEHHEFCAEVGKLFMKKFAEKFDFPPESERFMVMEIHQAQVGNA